MLLSRAAKMRVAVQDLDTIPVRNLFLTENRVIDKLIMGLFKVPCSSEPSISLTFGGVSYPVLSSAFNLGSVSTGSKDCVGGVVAGNQGFWIVGDVFMRGVYTCAESSFLVERILNPSVSSVFDFDHSEVGFATLA